MWSISRNGSDLGTATSELLRDMARCGVLRPTDHLWKEGMSAWRPAAEFKQLFPVEEDAEVIISSSDDVAVAETEPLIDVVVVERAPRRAAAANMSASTGSFDFTLVPRAANAARRGMQSLKARSRAVRPHAQAGRPRISSPKRILLIPGDFWAWLLPWAVLLGSILASLAIVFGVAATFFPQAMIRSIGLPADVVRSVRIAPSFSLSLAFWFAVNALLLATVAISGLVAFPLLRERSAQGWKIVFWQLVAFWGCVACGAISTLVSSPLVFIVALLFFSPLWLMGALWSYIVWRLRSRFGISA